MGSIRTYERDFFLHRTLIAPASLHLLRALRAWSLLRYSPCSRRTNLTFVRYTFAAPRFGEAKRAESTLMSEPSGGRWFLTAHWKEHVMLEFIGKGMGVIFLIGLAVVVGVLMLIF